jgi:hypothetical protein
MTDFQTTIVATNKADALTRIAASTLPVSVQAFLTAAVSALADDPVIQISASGHLHSSTDADVSTAAITVLPLRSV